MSNGSQAPVFVSLLVYGRNTTIDDVVGLCYSRCTDAQLAFGGF
jgi:hypothetical protein